MRCPCLRPARCAARCLSSQVWTPQMLQTSKPRSSRWSHASLWSALCSKAKTRHADSQWHRVSSACVRVRGDSMMTISCILVPGGKTRVSLHAQSTVRQASRISVRRACTWSMIARSLFVAKLHTARSYFMVDARLSVTASLKLCDVARIM